MLNRNEMRNAKKVVENLISTKRAVRFAVDGVIQDVAAGKFADDQVLIPITGQAGTVGAVRALPNWQTDPAIIDHLIAAVQGRMMHFMLIEQAGINPLNATAEQMAQLIAPTNKQQAAILVDICGKEAADAYEAKANKEFTDLMNEFAEHAANQGSVKF